ncbi:MAG: tripartite tricarboxylate transporter TctB family protein [Candidatus Puniceispirillaceae bacterium]
MRRAEIVTAFILGLFSIYLMWKSGEPPAWNPDAARFDNIGFDESGAPGSGFWPFWLGVIMLGSCVWTGVNWALRLTPASVSGAPFLDSYGKKMLLTVGGGLIGFLVLIELAGFYGGMLVFLVYYIRFLGRHSWAVTLPIAIGVPVICFFFFDIAMRIVLPKGYLEPLFIPLYAMFL